MLHQTGKWVISKGCIVTGRPTMRR
uniref:Uncharacterized protein n=1 Tax=Arundo donax TaxID=35708 RepID=A0A0A9AR54_ARUDO